MKKVWIIIPVILVLSIMIVGLNCYLNQKSLISDSYIVLNEYLSGPESIYATQGIYEEGWNEGHSLYRIVIASGMKSTGGYSIRVKKVSQHDNHYTIIVSERSPSVGEGVTMAYTYPICAIDFKEEPQSVVVITDKGNNFQKVILDTVSLKVDGKWITQKVNLNANDRITKIIQDILKSDQTRNYSEDFDFRIDFANGDVIEGNHESCICHYISEKIETGDKTVFSGNVNNLYRFLYFIIK